jgi:hypothetical protein
LHLLHEWGDPYSRGRSRTAGVTSILVHAAVIALLLLLPSNFLAPDPELEPKRTVIVTPLVEPLTEFTQKEPPKGKINREIDMASLQPKQRIQTPPAPPSTSRPAAPRAAEIPPAPPPRPAAPLPEPPKIEATVRDAPKLDLPPGAPPVAPQIQTVEKPKLALENVGGSPVPPAPGQSRLPIPNTSVADAVRQNVRGTAQGGVTVGDPGAGPGGIGVGINQPPSPGLQGSALELKSDAMGVDFRPYLRSWRPSGAIGMRCIRRARAWAAAAKSG